PAARAVSRSAVLDVLLAAPCRRGNRRHGLSCLSLFSSFLFAGRGADLFARLNSEHLLVDTLVAALVASAHRAGSLRRGRRGCAYFIAARSSQSILFDAGARHRCPVGIRARQDRLSLRRLDSAGTSVIQCGAAFPVRRYLGAAVISDGYSLAVAPVR